MKDSAISWTDHTFNPWWGCTEVSPGCENCYAREWARYTRGMAWGHHAPRRLASDAYWREPLRWDREAAAEGIRRRVFCASMADVFDAEVDQSWRDRLWDLIAATPALDWLLLTKRPNLIGRLAPLAWVRDGFPSNVWLGTSVEAQGQIWRLGELSAVSCRVHFVSVEPMLGPIDLQMRRVGVHCVDWVICGAESGPARRPFEVEWALDLRRQCVAAGVAFFAKQGPGLRSEAPFGHPELDGVREFPRGSEERRAKSEEQVRA